MSALITRVGFSIVLLAVFLLSPALSQTLPDSAADKAASAVTLPDTLTKETLRDVLSGISDAQARELLLQELDKKIAEQEASQGAVAHPLDVLAEWGVALGNSVVETFKRIKNIPGTIDRFWAGYRAQRGDASPWRIPGFLLLAMATGVFFTFVIHQFVKTYENKLMEAYPSSLWERVFALSVRFFLQFLKITGFIFGVYVINTAFNKEPLVDNLLVKFISIAVWWTFVSVMIARFMLSPQRPHLRLCYCDDKTASFLTFRFGVIFGWSAFTLSMLPKLVELGWPFGEVRIGFWFNLIFHLLIVITIWQARAGISQMVRGPHGNLSIQTERFAQLWPYIAIVFVVIEWLTIELFVATGNLQNLSFIAINSTLAILISLPLINQAIPAIVEAIWKEHPEDSEEEREIRDAERQAAGRCFRLIALFLVAVLLFGLWGVSWKDLASQGLGAQIAGSLTEIMLIFIVSYGLWEGLTIWTARQIIRDRAEMKKDPNYDPAYGVTRLETILPLLKGVGKATILVIGLLAILGEIGVNVVPLLAGAGVLGLAIGFGAQTLVKDIISGVFFLIDDAFRKDEYIDIGLAMGTVEKLSIRSMRLRHHDGVLNTIPFGEIGMVTNYSRDWGIMRLHLRMTYDTDLDRLAEEINKLGEELLEDESIGSKFQVKLTAEGVMSTDDSALLFRCAYKTKALDQWTMRGRIYARIRQMFEREGFKFAGNEVTVRLAGDEHEKMSADEKKKVAAAGAAAKTRRRKTADK